MLSRFLHTIAFLLLNLLNLTVGEGSKPIFDREEIKRAIGETEVEEHRTVGIVNLENSENKMKTLKRHSASLSPTGTRSHGPRRTSSRHSRLSHYSHGENDHSRERKDGERSYRDHRERPRDHSRDRRQTDRSRERPRGQRRVPPERYIEPVPFPIYYGNFQPRPLMVGPWVRIQGQVPHSPMMRPLRSFRTRSIPTDIYGFRPPLNPRFPQMF